ncbi:hypothetical protein [Enterocloster clostridioformis]|jgi:hypothetical protein|uniref:hypothetical protein n=1 Tax=Enterocloster clostridioformis TaxID=1531 RepID=UPI001408529F|nr:hypothetical protein [Enterocloster clostridioformis]
MKINMWILLLTAVPQLQASIPASFRNLIAIISTVKENRVNTPGLSIDKSYKALYT